MIIILCNEIIYRSSRSLQAFIKSFSFVVLTVLKSDSYLRIIFNFLFLVLTFYVLRIIEATEMAVFVYACSSLSPRCINSGGDIAGTRVNSPYLTTFLNIVDKICRQFFFADVSVCFLTARENKKQIE